MTGATMSVPIDLGSLMILAIAGMVGLIWKNLTDKLANLNDRIAAGDKAVDETQRERYRRLEDRLNTIDALPQRIEAVAEGLKRIEVMLAQSYVTKDEWRDSIPTRARKAN